jgi:hypothetical protein
VHVLCECVWNVVRLGIFVCTWMRANNAAYADAHTQASTNMHTHTHTHTPHTHTHLHIHTHASTHTHTNTTHTHTNTTHTYTHTHTVYVLVCRPRWARIIDGDDEGLYAWAAANYVSGALEVGVKTRTGP